MLIYDILKFCVLRFDTNNNCLICLNITIYNFNIEFNFLSDGNQVECIVKQENSQVYNGVKCTVTSDNQMNQDFIHTIRDSLKEIFHTLYHDRDS